jgi:hypothetical protein
MDGLVSVIIPTYNRVTSVIEARGAPVRPEATT